MVVTVVVAKLGEGEAIREAEYTLVETDAPRGYYVAAGRLIP
jgi:hypothetical protein